MKNIFVITMALILLGICFSACKPEDGLTPYQYIKNQNKGTVTALLNGQGYSGNVNLTTDSKRPDRINAKASVYINGYCKYSLSLDYLNYKSSEQIYRLRYDLGKDTCSSLFVIADHDAIEQWYYVAENYNNFVTIEDYDAANKIIKGAFQVSFFRDTGIPVPSPLGDTIHFTNGRFELKLPK